MIIKEIILRNYGSYGPIQRFKANPDINVIIGKNSVGKSILMDVLRKPDDEFKNNDDPITFLRIFSLLLSEEDKRYLIENQFQKIIEKFQDPQKIIYNELKKLTAERNQIFYDFLSLPVIYQFIGKSRNVAIGPFFIQHNTQILMNTEFQIALLIEEFVDNISKPLKSNQDTIDFVKVYKDILLNKETEEFIFKYKDSVEDRNKFIERFSQDFKQEIDNLSYNLNELIDIFFKNIYYFSDVRDRPVVNNHAKTNILTGRESAYILFQLHNSKNLPERDMYDNIVKEFTKFYPNFEIYVTNGPEILVKIMGRFKEDGSPLTLPIESMGMGFTELVTFFINIHTQKNKIFILEEPENHLHPNNQKNLMDLIKRASVDNQSFIISHSPNFINISDITKNTIIRRIDGFSKIVQVDRSQFSDNEIRRYFDKFYYDQPENLELFFADKVLLVEGGTEKLGLTQIADLIKTPFPPNNIFILNTKGKDKIPIYNNLLMNFGIPFLILCDQDAYTFLKSKNIDMTRVTAMEPDFEGPLKQRYSDHFAEVTKDSKPFQFQYALEKLVEDHGVSEIPNKYIEVIEKISQLSILNGV